MVGMLWSQTDARSVVEPEASAFGLLCRDLHPLTPPDAFDTLLVHRPARSAKQRRDPAVSVTAILAGKRNDVGGQCRFIIRCCRCLALCGAMLAKGPARPSLRYTKLCRDMA